jgi:hypothetical protein
MTKNTVKLICRLTTIAVTLSALAGTTLAGPCPMHRHKPTVGFYQQSINSTKSSVNLKKQQAIENDSNTYELPNRPGFDPYLRG